MKALEKLAAKNPAIIRDWYRDPDGYWINLHYGWQLWGCHSLHELTVSQALETFKAVEPCDCLECRTDGEQWEDIDLDTGKLRIFGKPQD